MDIKAKMDRINLRLQELTTVQKNMLFIIPPLLIVAVCTYFLILPGFQEKGRLTEETVKQTSDITTLEKSSSALPALQAENRRLTARLMELQLQLPDEKEVSGLLKRVSELGVQSGLQVASWKPKPKNVYQGNEVYEIPVDVEMRGTYHKFGKFFSNITAVGRIVNISNIAMKPGDQKLFPRGVTGLNVTFTAVTYSLIPESEKKTLKDQKK
jgi:type IV pilus assembly protein PilO